MTPEYTKPEHMVWIDIETTGLSPEQDTMLEIGMVITDLSLEVLEVESYVLRPEGSAFGVMVPFVQEMHQRSGLSDLIGAGMWTEDWAAEAPLMIMLENYFGELLPPMCGSSVHFDREFIRRRFSTLHDRFSYRNIDVSTIKEMAERFNPAVWLARPQATEEEKAHRAIDDCFASIAEMKFYLDTGFITRAIDPTPTGA